MSKGNVIPDSQIIPVLLDIGVHLAPLAPVLMPNGAQMRIGLLGGHY